MKKTYSKPIMTVVCVKKTTMICASLLKGGNAKGRITSADSRGLFFDDEEDYSDNANDYLFRN